MTTLVLIILAIGLLRIIDDAIASYKASKR